VKLKTKV